MAKHILSRRKFIRNAGCAAIGSATLMNTLTNLKFINSAAAINQFDDYKAMVVILLSGGNDSYNMLVPYGDAEYAQYATTRSNLALSQESLLSLDYTDIAGKQFAVHNAMPNVQSLFNSDKLAFVSNIGTLVEPTTKDQVYNGGAQLPLGLYSHADQVMHWQTAIPQDRVAQGWGGKIADMFSATSEDASISMNLSFAGTNVFQTGNSSVEYTVDPMYGAIELDGYTEPWEVPTANRNTIDSLIGQYYEDIFKKTYIDVVKVGKEGAEQFNEAIGDVDVNTSFSNSQLSQSFKMIAKTIQARETLGLKRQIFFIDFGGFDLHDEVIGEHSVLLAELDTALGEFNTALDEIDMQEAVTTFSLSEFARTLTSNGVGSDHAWGANAFIMGGAVNGGKIYGTYPDLDLNNSLELGGGVFVPTTATDQYFGDICSWFGVENSELLTLFPNIDNFDSIYNGNPLGLLS